MVAWAGEQPSVENVMSRLLAVASLSVGTEQRGRAGCGHTVSALKRIAMHRNTLRRNVKYLNNLLSIHFSTWDNLSVHEHIEGWFPFLIST